MITVCIFFFLIFFIFKQIFRKYWQVLRTPTSTTSYNKDASKKKKNCYRVNDLCLLPLSTLPALQALMHKTSKVRGRGAASSTARLWLFHEDFSQRLADSFEADQILSRNQHKVINDCTMTDGPLRLRHHPSSAHTPEWLWRPIQPVQFSFGSVFFTTLPPSHSPLMMLFIIFITFMFPETPTWWYCDAPPVQWACNDFCG